MTIIKRENLINNYIEYEKKYNRVLNCINDGIFKILSKMLKELEVYEEEIVEIKNLYSIAEVNYIEFMSYLKGNNKNIYETIPHGTEDINVW